VLVPPNVNSFARLRTNRCSHTDNDNGEYPADVAAYNFWLHEAPSDLFT